MIQVPLAEPTDPAWAAWRTRADQKRQLLVDKAARGEEIKIDEALYKEMRQAIWDAFYGKCAYCEVWFAVDQTGDVEHFRPKGGVTDENDVRAEVTAADGSRQPHPGYYWLAYDWTNLLPSCSKCNRPTRDGTGKLRGKWNRFPVSGTRADAPGGEASEAPLLLHPRRQDPALHFEIDSTGVLSTRTPEGAKTLEVLDLNRAELVEQRRKTYRDVKALVGSLSQGLLLSSPQTLADLGDLLDYRRGKAPFSFAGRQALEDSKGLLAPLLALFGL